MSSGTQINLESTISSGDNLEQTLKMFINYFLAGDLASHLAKSLVVLSISKFRNKM